VKKLLFLAVTLFILFSVFINANAQGKVTGMVLNTDIIAYINGFPIPSYNINGWTGIVAEDLTDYGFDVFWDAEQRELFISYYKNPDFKITADYVPQKSDMPVGSHLMDVFQTDIKTYVDGDLTLAAEPSFILIRCNATAMCNGLKTKEKFVIPILSLGHWMCTIRIIMLTRPAIFSHSLSLL